MMLRCCIVIISYFACGMFIDFILFIFFVLFLVLKQKVYKSMQNAECIMHNFGVRFADDWK